MEETGTNGFFDDRGKHDYLKDVEKWIREIDKLYDEEKLTIALHREYENKLNSLSAKIPKSRRSDPSHFILYEMRGLLYDYEGKHSESSQCLETAYKLKAHNAEFITKRAHALTTRADNNLAGKLKKYTKKVYEDKGKAPFIVAGSAAIVLVFLLSTVGIDNYCHSKAVEKMGFRAELPTTRWSSEDVDLYNLNYEMCKRNIW